MSIFELNEGLLSRLRSITYRDIDDVLIVELETTMEKVSFESRSEVSKEVHEQAMIFRDLLRHGCCPLPEIINYFAGKKVDTKNLIGKRRRKDKEINKSPFVAFVAQGYWDVTNDHFAQIIEPACYWENIRPLRMDLEVKMPSLIQKIYEGFQKANLFIADLTENEPNVFYELGYFDAKNIEGLCVAPNFGADRGKKNRNFIYTLTRDIIVFERGPRGLANNRKTLRAGLREIVKRLTMKELDSGGVAKA